MAGLVPWSPYTTTVSETSPWSPSSPKLPHDSKDGLQDQRKRGIKTNGSLLRPGLGGDMNVHREHEQPVDIYLTPALYDRNHTYANLQFLSVDEQDKVKAEIKDIHEKLRFYMDALTDSSKAIALLKENIAHIEREEMKSIISERELERACLDNSKYSQQLDLTQVPYDKEKLSQLRRDYANKIEEIRLMKEKYTHRLEVERLKSAELDDNLVQLKERLKNYELRHGSSLSLNQSNKDIFNDSSMNDVTNSDYVRQHLEQQIALIKDRLEEERQIIEDMEFQELEEQSCLEEERETLCLAIQTEEQRLLQMYEEREMQLESLQKAQTRLREDLRQTQKQFEMQRKQALEMLRRESYRQRLAKDKSRKLQSQLDARLRTLQGRDEEWNYLLRGGRGIREEVLGPGIQLPIASIYDTLKPNRVFHNPNLLIPHSNVNASTSSISQSIFSNRNPISPVAMVTGSVYSPSGTVDMSSRYSTLQRMPSPLPHFQNSISIISPDSVMSRSYHGTIGLNSSPSCHIPSTEYNTSIVQTSLMNPPSWIITSQLSPASSSDLLNEHPNSSGTLPDVIEEASLVPSLQRKALLDWDIDQWGMMDTGFTRRLRTNSDSEISCKSIAFREALETSLKESDTHYDLVAKAQEIPLSGRHSTASTLSDKANSLGSIQDLDQRGRNKTLTDVWEFNPHNPHLPKNRQIQAVTMADKGSSASSSSMDSPSPNFDTSTDKSNYSQGSKFSPLMVAVERRRVSSPGEKINHIPTAVSSVTRPLTRFLPVVDDPDFDLRAHLETTCGHPISQLTSPSSVARMRIDKFSCAGPLHKMGGGLRAWHKRWFVLDRRRHMLAYYKSHDSKKIKGCISFADIIDVYTHRFSSVKSPSPQLTFCVITPLKSFYLIAPLPEAMRTWIDAIFTGAEGYLVTMNSAASQFMPRGGTPFETSPMRQLPPSIDSPKVQPAHLHKRH